MPALLLVLLAAAWAGDGLLRHVVDAGLRRHALLDRAGHALAGIVLLAWVVELAVPLPFPLARAALHAFAVVGVGFALAADDAPPREPMTALHRLREAAPLVDALALALLAGWLLAPGAQLVQGAMRLTGWAGIVLFVRLIAPALDARLAVSSAGWRLQGARLGSAVLLGLSLLGARAWLP
jgi:hypothetical protein